MAKRVYTPRELATKLEERAKLAWVSGKWFNSHNEEIKDPDKYIMQVMPEADSVRVLRDIKDMYITLYGEQGLWPELPIIAKARALNAPLPPLPFPLSTKQLKVIRVLLTMTDAEVMFVITGVGGSGKSTFLNIIKQIYAGDVCACALSDLTGYNVAVAVKSRLIAADELSSDELDNKTLKTIISRQQTQVNPKFEAPYQVQCQSALVYCCNATPKIDIDDSGMLRRIVYLHMNEPIKDPDPSFNHKTWTDGDLCVIVAHALAIDMTNWRDDFEKETRELLTINNSVYILKDDNEYSDYAYNCRCKGLRPYSEPRWRAIRELLISWGMIKSDEEILLEKVQAACSAMEVSVCED